MLSHEVLKFIVKYVYPVLYKTSYSCKITSKENIFYILRHIVIKIIKLFFEAAALNLCNIFIFENPEIQNVFIFTLCGKYRLFYFILSLIIMAPNFTFC